MTAVGEQLPAGRYGGSADQRADRKLKVIGAVLGAVALVVVGWFGYQSIGGKSISGEVISWDIASDHAVDVHLEVRKDANVHGTCTLRLRETDGDEVGRKDARFDQREKRIDQVITVRTTARATSVELVGCQTGS
ncbi:DUF4307 domain-containing protein [Streptomyces sp. NBC_01387]|uniref:DUF4307 domain-containing protein n=1 Tax=unclassified Streptomyces TaxID=2593676 RepID=UPI002256F192|nr:MULTISPECIES: DUF4307 domain-containing protein [unclassified Streptomyces]MCX4548599.1 DUF4307 domain-containing protein [Streptomyces sp. NBC_01500]WSV54234.1 DUF4307 domain-containing protein [Streptomyces sp. NBC_01014]